VFLFFSVKRGRNKEGGGKIKKEGRILVGPVSVGRFVFLFFLFPALADDNETSLCHVCHSFFVDVSFVCIATSPNGVCACVCVHAVSIMHGRLSYS